MHIVQENQRRQTMSKCPFCGAELESEVYRNMPHSYMGYKFSSCEYTLYCPNGDFGTDYTCPSKARKELVSAYQSCGKEAEE